MEIRSLEIDFDREILRINGKEVKGYPVIVTLPGPENRIFDMKAQETTSIISNVI